MHFTGYLRMRFSLRITFPEHLLCPRDWHLDEAVGPSHGHPRLAPVAPPVLGGGRLQRPRGLPRRVPPPVERYDLVLVGQHPLRRQLDILQSGGMNVATCVGANSQEKATYFPPITLGRRTH